MDPVLQFMRENGIPETRENYLEVAFMGTPPVELDAEEEAALPAQFQFGGREGLGMTQNRPPVGMTIGQMFRQLALVMEKATPEERLQFKEAWLKSVVEFNRRTEEIRYANWKRS